jgi:hypothetical protein
MAWYGMVFMIERSWAGWVLYLGLFFGHCTALALALISALGRAFIGTVG